MIKPPSTASDFMRSLYEHAISWKWLRDHQSELTDTEHHAMRSHRAFMRVRAEAARSLRIREREIAELYAKVAELSDNLDAETKAGGSWRELARQRNIQRKGLSGKLNRIIVCLEKNGCDCECGHDSEGHDKDCDRCMGCRISEILDEE